MRLNPDVQSWGDDAWLALATYPDGRKAVIAAPECQFDPLVPLTKLDAERLARGIDWHPSCHGVGEVVPVRYATHVEDEPGNEPVPAVVPDDERPLDPRLHNLLVLDVPDMLWRRRGVTGDLRRFAAIEVNGVRFELAAWPLGTGSGPQDLDGQFPEDLDLLSAIVGGEGPFATISIQGREHVVVMYPHRT